MILIGITGLLGAGKGTAVDYLIKSYDFHHYSARKFLHKEALERGLEPNRESYHLIANEISTTLGPSGMIQSLINEAKKDGHKRIIVESLHRVGEVDAIEQEGGSLIAVIAERSVRYERIALRNSETDKNISFEDFCAQEDSETENPDPAKQNLFACIKRATKVFDNTEEGPEKLHTQVDEWLKRILFE